MKIPHLSLAPRAHDAESGFAPGRGPLRPVLRSRAPRRVALWALVLGVLGGVFLSYLSPDMMFTLATQVWSCF